MTAGRVVIVGAGIGGLAAALELTGRGADVLLLERAAAPGGKMREVRAGPARLDAGPTVFTMRWVFEELFEAAGARLADHLALRPATILARHAWTAEARLDLFADVARSAEAIGAFAGAAEARGFLSFCARARRTYEALEGPFIRAARPSPVSLAQAAGLRGMARLWEASPFQTFWKALGDHFSDPRLRQLFGRYATYCGSSPFLAPATLMLVAHVEQDGVWLVEGGMHRVAQTLAALATRRGASIRYGTAVDRIDVEAGRVTGVRLADGERIVAAAVVVNADVAAVSAGLFGRSVAGAVSPVAARQRSLSAVTWGLHAQARNFPLSRHNVFFSDDYPAEFDAILNQQRLPTSPTVYVCAQDRGADGEAFAADGPERLLCLVNAPAAGDTHPPSPSEIDACATATFDHLRRCGLELETNPDATVVTTPENFAAMFPGTGGALYGQASHGWRASFSRPGARTNIPGLFMAGGSTHPGPGVPMAALSGRLAASAVLESLASTGRSRGVAMSGGMSTR